VKSTITAKTAERMIDCLSFSLMRGMPKTSLRVTDRRKLPLRRWHPIIFKPAIFDIIVLIARMFLGIE
jgi:hypothetical protein